MLYLGVPPTAVLVLFKLVGNVVDVGRTQVCRYRRSYMRSGERTHSDEIDVCASLSGIFGGLCMFTHVYI